MTHSFLTHDTDTGERLDRFLAARLQLSRAVVKEAIRNGACTVDGTCVTRHTLRLTKDRTILFTPQEPESSLQTEDGELDIVHEDDDLLVINKPAGMTVHPCPSCPLHTLLQILAGRFPELLKMDGARPGIVHRLDKDTSGLLVVARTERARQRLTQAFADREITKIYLALVSGSPPDSGSCREPIGRDPHVKTRMCVLPERMGGRAAHTEFSTLWRARNHDCALLRVHIHTGRTHQIRVHMAHLGYPLLGDALYAPKEIRTRAGRQMLHALHLSLEHPVTREQLSFTQHPPDDFFRCACTEARIMNRLVITGNPAAGKSLLTSFLAEKGVPVFSADACVHAIYAEQTTVQDWLRLRNETQCIAADGTLLRQELQTCFVQKTILRKELETMLHGMVHDALQTFWQEQEARAVPLAAAEIPLWFECGWTADSILTVCVDAPFDIRLERMKERGWSVEKALQIEGWQWNAERKAKAARYVLRNTSSIEAFRAEAETFWAELQESLRKETLSEETRLRTFMQYHD